jgi:hypothetical protein
MTVAERGKSFLRGLPRGPMIMILLAIIAPIITIPIISHLLSLFGIKITPQNYYTILGPVLGSALTLLTIGASDLAKYCSSTTTLNYELDVECWSDDCRNGRVSALIENRGRVVVRDAKGVASIAVVRGSNREQSLKGFLVRDACEDRGMLVNEVNPHVIGEALAWDLPETTYWLTFKTDNQPVNANYAHITSISPGQRSRLLIFDYGV